MSAPMTPPECDLQDFPFMPLHVARLRDSDLAAEESPEACWYAVLLWAAAWHQIPAGSLPDNDAVLTKLIGLGRDVRTFRKHKAGALRGFVLCDDGRLYHPVVAEQALNAWESKLQQRWRTECARIKKANQRNGLDLPTPTYEQFLSGIVPDPGPQSVPEDEAQCPSGQLIQGTGTGTGTGTGRTNNSLEGAQPDPANETGVASAARRGSRLPDDWAPSPADIAYATGEQGFTPAEVERIAQTFRDYWRAAAGQKATKLDWPATWRNWIRTERDRRPRPAAGGSPRVGWV